MPFPVFPVSRLLARPALHPAARAVSIPGMKPEIFDIPFIHYGVKGYGFMLMIGFLTGIWWAARRAMKVKANPDMILNVGFIALVFGVIGARAFYVLHYWHRTFAGRPLADIVNLTAGGLEFYGGFVGAMVFIILYVAAHGRPVMARGLALFWIALAVFIGLLLFAAFAPAPPRSYVVGIIALVVLIYIVRSLWQWSGRAGGGQPASLRLYLDIMTPSLMWGLAFGRMGCFLNGCCWGATCENPRLPWAVQFPAGSPAQYDQWTRCETTLPASLIYIEPRTGIAYPMPRELLDAKSERLYLLARNRYEAAEEKVKELERAKAGEDKLKVAKAARDRAKTVWTGVRLSEAPKIENMRVYGLHASDIEHRARAADCLSRYVHPVQLYSAVNALLLAFLLNAVFHRRKRHGVVFGLMWLLYPIVRIVEELIRADNPLDTGGMTISQAVSVGGVVFALLWFWWLSKLPLRSPRAVAFVPPAPAKESDKTKKR